MRFFARSIFLFTYLLLSVVLLAQDNDSSSHQNKADSSFTLQGITVTAFSLQSRWQQAPAAVSVVTQKQLQLLGNTSLIPIFNTVAGVRMEERSPGSYRLSIRGSLLRSPFGVRNIKMYWNDIPLTDAGGNTYLQLIDINNIQSAEIIKGPASSLYGANTGGAVILHSGVYTTQNHATVSATAGSYGLINGTAAYSYAYRNFQSGVQYSHQQSDGYRQQSSLRRDMIKWDGNWRLSTKEKIDFLSFYSDLYYQTPGGLTASQLGTDTTAYPLAVINRTYLRNKTLFGGASLTSVIAKHLDNITTITANHTSFINPATRNYEIRDENNYGGRTTFFYHTETQNLSFKWLAGAEWLRNHSFIDDYQNDSGSKAAALSKNEFFATQTSFFAQISAVFSNRLTIQAGVSNNQQIIRLRLPDSAGIKAFDKTNTKALLAPRLSVLYNVVNDLNLYGIVAEGFSAPTLEERHPSGTEFNERLHPEQGWNYEAGIKGSALKNRLLFDASVYSFHLQNAIVSRKTADNADSFVNAGKTNQTGIELWIKAFLYNQQNAFLSSLSIANSFSYQPYHFTSYFIDTNNYSGNRLTGVPRTINVTTFEAASRTGFYVNVIFNTVSSISLNDAATVYAKPYHLLQSKIGFQHTLGRLKANAFIGGDNLFNETYSLGNDINAAGKRYYNPAPKRNYFIGLTLGI